MFVTAFSGVLDTATGAFTYSCAGHNPPRLLRTPGRTVISLLGARTLPLGLFEESSGHTEETVVLVPGDLALFYTDGITEARSCLASFSVTPASIKSCATCLTRRRRTLLSNRSHKRSPGFPATASCLTTRLCWRCADAAKRSHKGR